MRKYTEHCDLCEKEITKESGREGFCLDLGYSRGGWGRRGDFIPKFSGEICNECFEPIKKKSEELCKTINNLKQ